MSLPCTKGKVKLLSVPERDGLLQSFPGSRMRLNIGLGCQGEGSPCKRAAGSSSLEDTTEHQACVCRVLSSSARTCPAHARAMLGECPCESALALLALETVQGDIFYLL